MRAECTVSLSGCRAEVAREWSEIKRHDVVFLLTIATAVDEGGKPDGSLPFPERVGLAFVRGAEVTQVVDEEGHVHTGESENDQPLRGTVRKPELRAAMRSQQPAAATAAARMGRASSSPPVWSGAQAGAAAAASRSPPVTSQEVCQMRS